MIYDLELGFSRSQHSVLSESLSPRPILKNKPYFSREPGGVVLAGKFAEGFSLRSDETFLRAYRTPNDPTPTGRVREALEGIRIYRQFDTSPRSNTRHGISATTQNDFLFEDGSNLAAVLASRAFAPALPSLSRWLPHLAERFSAISTHAGNGILQVFIQEQGLVDSIPGSRLSDGTLRILCLLAVLLHPQPPRLVCIEEPELGLHPQIIRDIANLIIEASDRMQLLVTTHSIEFINALGGHPESVLA
ncbi:MAG: hypothetical protein B7X34_02320, partial [Acidobacteriia bacterium 12-62-4]